MFVFSLKMTKLKSVCAVVTVFIIGTVCALCIKATRAANDPKASFVARNRDDHIRFVSSFGWQVSQSEPETLEVIIPEDFNDVYRNYNEMQKRQGFNLEEYKGLRVKRFTYEIINYPNGVENVVVNLLVYDNKIIGGDVCCTALDGFMHGFEAEISEKV